VYFGRKVLDRVSSIRHFDDDGAALATFDYDRDGRGNIAHDAGSPFAYFEYAYDAAGRIVRTERENGDIISYGYEDADRLTAFDWRDAGPVSALSALQRLMVPLRSAVSPRYTGPSPASPSTRPRGEMRHF
jgi:YD repeat-containing protein